MKKKLKIALFLILIMAFVFAFAACDNKPQTPGTEEPPTGEHTHSYGEWEVTNATCTADGFKKRVCSECQNEESEVITATGHNFSNCVCANCGAVSHTLNENCVCTVCGKTDHAATVAKNGYCLHGKDYYFGSYPQTKVTDDKLTAALTRSAGDLPTSEDAKGWSSYNYFVRGKKDNFMWYIDKEYVGDIYRGVYFTYYRPIYGSDDGTEKASQQDDNAYMVGNVYWFKFEPVKWIALEERAGTALLLADLCIDSQCYYHDDYAEPQLRNGKEVYSNNYAESEIRAWLNDNFYKTAFNEMQKGLIQATEVDNSVDSTGDINHGTADGYACDNTNDKVFLLSYKEVTNNAYGFVNYKLADTLRSAKASDYAKCQGCSWDSGNGSSYWWLRSPSGDDYEVCYVSSSGNVKNSDIVADSSFGIRPTLRISLGK